MVKVKLRHILPLFYILITLGYSVVVFYVVSHLSNDAIPIIRGPTQLDLLLLFLGSPISMCMILLFGKIIAFLNFKILSKFQIHYEHYFVDMGDRDISTATFFNRALVPVFMCLAISLLLNNIGIFSSFFGRDQISSIIFLSLMISPLVFFLFLPIWIFKDAGVLRLRKRSENRIPPKLTFFGNFQYQSYKGFAEITTPLMYIITIYGAVSISRNIVDIVISFIILLYPLFLMGYFMPAFLLYEKRIKKLREKIVKILNLPPLTPEIIGENVF